MTARDALARVLHTSSRCGVGAISGPHEVAECPNGHLFTREADAILSRLAASGWVVVPSGAVLVTPDDVAVLRKAHAIGAVSHDGDGWFAANAGYGYDEAEAMLTAAAAILAARLTEPDRETTP